MTRYPPQGPPQGGESYAYQQPPQYGGNESYGACNPGEDQGQGYGQPQYNQQPQYGNEAPNYAQSYYGSNEQPYQPYPGDRYGGQQYQGGPPQYQAPLAQQAPAYGGAQQYPPYAQQYPPQPSYGPGMQGRNDDVAAFASHYEQPHGALPPSVDPTTGQPLPPSAEAEADRGIMGALAGGAAGAYGGHKVNHGFLGTIGGAVAGSMLEDAYKKHNRRNSGSSSHSNNNYDHNNKQAYNQGSGGNGVMAGNFHASSRNVRLEGHCTLVAECADVHGHHRDSRLDLNECFTNDGGRLEWARGGNFAATARHIRLVEGGAALEAELGDGRGGWVGNKVWLNERITNEDGRLEML